MSLSDQVPINTYEQLTLARKADLPDVAISPWRVGIRSKVQAGWYVWSPGKDLGRPGLSQFDDSYGKKIFSEIEFKTESWKQARQLAFAAAVKWAARRYKVSEFVRNRDFNYVDDRVNAAFPLRKIT